VDATRRLMSFGKRSQCSATALSPLLKVTDRGFLVGYYPTPARIPA
jgi:hypothetical protein